MINFFDSRLPGGVRLFEHMPGGPIPAEEMTANKCILGCATSSYTLAGLENGQWVIFFLFNPSPDSLPCVSSVFFFFFFCALESAVSLPSVCFITYPFKYFKMSARVR